MGENDTQKSDFGQFLFSQIIKVCEMLLRGKDLAVLQTTKFKNDIEMDLGCLWKELYKKIIMKIFIILKS